MGSNDYQASAGCEYARGRRKRPRLIGQMLESSDRKNEIETFAAAAAKFDRFRDLEP
jgi:hypothetical protein